VNISSRQFSHPNLINEISETLHETGLSPLSLSLEITESVIMENADSAASMLEQLKAIGIQVHIDDFGTGYSSLSYIHRFPISALKIDRSFVSEMSGDVGKEEIVKSIIYLARNLQLDVIAEGLEMKDQLNQFRELRCHYGQGYLFSRPLEPDQAEQWIIHQDADALKQR
jgi:EAL domain-containing protein (putative c-di-GMP-specific phosphodiesterase class I)